MYFLEGFQLGFYISYLGPRASFMTYNLSSVHGLENIVNEKIQKELKEGQC